MKRFALRSVALLALAMAMLSIGVAAPRDPRSATDDKRRVADAHLELANAYFS